MRRGLVVVMAVAFLALGACSAAPTAHNHAASQIDDDASRLGNRFEASRFDLTASGRPDSTALALARIANDPDGNPTVLVLRADGDVERDGAMLVVRFALDFSDVGGPSSLTKCFKYTVTEASFHVARTTVSCPPTPPISIPPPPTTLPDLGNLIDGITHTINALTAAQRHDIATVQRAVEGAVAGNGVVVAADRRDDVIGIAITRQIDCLLARVADTVEVWRPASVYPAYGRPGEISCHPLDAIERNQQQPPH